MSGIFNRSIGARLAGLIALLLVLISLGAGISVVGLGELRTVTAQMVNSGNNLQTFAEIKQIMGENRAQVLLTLQHDPAGPWAKLHDHPVDMHLDQVVANRDKITSLWQAYIAQSLPDEERQLAERYAEVRKRYVQEGLMAARRMRDNLRTLLIDTRQSAEAIAAAAQSMSAAGAQVEKSSGAQSEAASAAAAVEQTSVSISETANNAHTADEMATRASADTAPVTESVRSIAAAVREQDAAVQQVAQRMEQIAQMTEENTAAAGNASDTARQLDGLAGQLREAVGRFKV